MPSASMSSVHPLPRLAPAARILGLAAGCAIGIASPVLAQEASPETSSPTTSGNDVIHPIQRIDLRAEVNSKEDTDELTTTLRYTRPQPIGGGWTVNLRADLPFVRNNETSTVRVGRDALRGVVDVLRIKYHQLRGHYESRELAALVRDEFLADSRHELDSRTAPARAPSVPVLASALFMPSPPTGASADMSGGAM